MTEWLYDRRGQAHIFLYDEDRFISKTGVNLGWTLDKNVYSLKGIHIGWYEDGVLYDNRNTVMAFKLNCSACLPFVPSIGLSPWIPDIPVRPDTPAFSRPPGRPGYGGWSKSSMQEMFKINFY